MSDQFGDERTTLLRRTPVHLPTVKEGEGLKPRMGGAYVRSICAQAGVGFVETPGEEDLDAVDALVRLRGSEVRVQIKCSSQFTLTGTSASWPMKSKWLERWRASDGPVFLILVIVSRDATNWVQHNKDHTRMAAGAWWARVDNLDPTTERLTGLRERRLTTETFYEWRDIHLAKLRDSF